MMVFSVLSNSLKLKVHFLNYYSKNIIKNGYCDSETPVC